MLAPFFPGHSFCFDHLLFHFRLLKIFLYFFSCKPQRTPSVFHLFLPLFMLLLSRFKFWHNNMKKQCTSFSGVFFFLIMAFVFNFTLLHCHLKKKWRKTCDAIYNFFCAFCRLLFCCLISGYLMSSYDILSKVNFSMIKIETNSFPRIVIQCFPFVHTNPGVFQFIMNKSSSRARVAIHSNRIGGWQCPIFILCS